MKGIKHFMRNFSATAVKEHLRSEIEATGGSPDLTKNEIELVRFIYEGSFDWRAFFGQSFRRLIKMPAGDLKAPPHAPS
jgi:hypothetical protein